MHRDVVLPHQVTFKVAWPEMVLAVDGSLEGRRVGLTRFDEYNILGWTSGVKLVIPDFVFIFSDKEIVDSERLEHMIQ